MSAAIVTLAALVALEAFAAIWFAAKAGKAEDKADSIDRHLLDVARKAREASDRAFRYQALALRAVALLRDDAHRSRQAKDGTRRYDAWRADRDALIREVEG